MTHNDLLQDLITAVIAVIVSWLTTKLAAHKSARPSSGGPPTGGPK